MKPKQKFLKLKKNSILYTHLVHDINTHFIKIHTFNRTILQYGEHLTKYKRKYK